MKNLIHILNNYHDPFPHMQGRGGLQFHPSRRIIGGMLGGAEETEITPVETAITTTTNDSDDEDEDDDNPELDEYREYLDPTPFTNEDMEYYKTAPKDALQGLERQDLQTTVEQYKIYNKVYNDYVEKYDDPNYKTSPYDQNQMKTIKNKIEQLIATFHNMAKFMKDELLKNQEDLRYKKYLEINKKLKYNLIQLFIKTLHTFHLIDQNKPKEDITQLDQTNLTYIKNKFDYGRMDEIDKRLNNGVVVEFHANLLKYISMIDKSLRDFREIILKNHKGDRSIPYTLLFTNDKIQLIDDFQKRNNYNKKLEKEKDKLKKLGNEKILAEQAIIAKSKADEFLKELEQEDKGKKSKKKDKKELVKMELRAEEPEPEVIEAEEPEPEKVSKKKGGKKEKAIAVETVVDTRTIAEREADLLKQNVIIATNLDKSIDNIFTMSDHKDDVITFNDRDKLLKHYIKTGENPDAFNILKTITKLQIKLKPSKNQLELYRKTQATIDTNKKGFDMLDADVLKLMEGTEERPKTYSAGDAYEIVLFENGQGICRSLTGSKINFVLNLQIPTASSRTTEGIMMDYSGGLDLETLKRAFTYDLLNDLFCIEAKNYYSMFFLSELKQNGGVVMQITKFLGRPPFANGKEQGYYKPYYILENNKLKLYNVCQTYQSSKSGPFEQKWIFKGKSKEVYFNVKCRDCIVGMNLKDILFHLDPITDPIGTRTDLLTIDIEKSIAKGVLMKGDTNDTVKIPLTYFKPIT